MQDNSYRGDLQVCWPQFLKVVPQIDLAEARFYLVFDVFLEKGNGVLRSCSWVGAVVDRGRDDVPVPLWACGPQSTGILCRHSFRVGMNGWTLARG